MRHQQLEALSGIDEKLLSELQISDDLKADNCLPKCVVIQHNNWAEQERFHKKFEGNLEHCRVGIDGDRIWVGPYFRPGRSGCNHCFRKRLRSNHPAEEISDFLFDKSLDAATNHAAFPRPILRIVRSLIDEIINESVPHLHPYYILNGSTGAVEKHNFFPNHECPHCSIRQLDSADHARIEFESQLKEHPRDSRTKNEKLTSESLEQLLFDYRSGLVKHTFVDTASQLMPMVVAESMMFSGGEATMGYGRSASMTESRLVALLETLERYTSTRPKGFETSVRGSYSELASDAINPRLFSLHDESQYDEPGYNLVPYHDDLEISWRWCHSLRRGKPVLIPEQIAYYGLADTKDLPVNRFVHDTSSGSAIGGGMLEASLFGLFELIERDGYMAGWYGRFPYPKLDCSDAIDPDIQMLLARARAEGYRLHLFDMTLESGVPSIWAIIEDPRKNAPVRSYCAAGCRTDPEKAIVAALVEVITSMAVYRESMSLKKERARMLLDHPSNVQKMEDHVLLFSQDETFDALKFLPIESVGVPLRERFADWYKNEPSLDMRDDFFRVTEKIMNVAEDVLIVNQSMPEMEALGLSAVKVCAPGLLPISFGHQYRRINLNRINQAAQFLNIGTRYTQANINQFPHNFP